MNTNIEIVKPNECPQCNIKFPHDDNMRWSLYNINKHIKACEEKNLEKDKIKKSQKSLTSFFSKLSNYNFYKNNLKLIKNC
jgi:hypothetical protein